MGAKLNSKTYLQNRIFNFLSHLSEGSKSYDCTKTLVYSIYFYPFAVRCVCYVTLSTNSWGSKLMPKSEQNRNSSAEQFA
jgi:hypothetical protein